MRIVAIGEILWDVFADSERLGGASFNFAVNAHRLGHEVLFVSAVGNDERGRKALARMRDLGLPAKFVRQTSQESTGTVTVSVDASGQPDYVLHRPAAYDAVDLPSADLAALAEFHPDWVYFGTLHQVDSRARSATAKLIESLGGAKRFYDINLRKNSYTPELVSRLLSDAVVVKLNEEEMIVVEKFLGWKGSRSANSAANPRTVSAGRPSVSLAVSEDARSSRMVYTPRRRAFLFKSPIPWARATRSPRPLSTGWARDGRRLKPPISRIAWVRWYPAVLVRFRSGPSKKSGKRMAQPSPSQTAKRYRAWMLLSSVLAVHIANEAAHGFLDFTIRRIAASPAGAVADSAHIYLSGVDFPAGSAGCRALYCVALGAAGFSLDRVRLILFRGDDARKRRRACSGVDLHARWMPGTYTAPLVLAAAIYLLVEAFRDRR